MTTFLEHATVTKGHLSCIIGSSTHGVKWSCLVVDFILQKLLKLEKTNIIICRCMDRQSADFYCSFPKNNQENIVFIGPDSYESTNCIIEKCNPAISTTINQGVCRSSLSCVLFSISEIVLQYSLRDAMRLLEVVSSWKLGSFVTNIHSTLHSNQIQAQLESFFTSIGYININNGLFANEVILEVQTIKKSRNGGKITEATELFGWNAQPNCGSLYCIHRHKEPKLDAEKANETSLENNSNQLSNEININKRLILFDSTDPEFDEDSDPDADLDL